nr:MAG TPA: hypothetical protein [Bacteriophage sp.]
MIKVEQLQLVRGKIYKISKNLLENFELQCIIRISGQNRV